jgi:hypothetical protein
LNADEKLKSFLNGIDEYITSKNIVPHEINEQVAISESFTLEQLDKLTQDECFNHSFQLYQYIDHLSKERAKCENVVRWCENNLQKIISHCIQDEHWDKYDKYEFKVATIMRNNELVSRINDWKISAEGRLENIKSREYNVRKKAEVLTEKGKRR